MKKQSEWFMNQTLQTKITLVVMGLLAVFFILFILGNLINSSQTNQNKDDSSVIIEPTKTPLPEESSNPEKTTTPPNYGPEKTFNFPYGEESLNNLISTSEQALITSCKIVEGQTVQEKTEILRQFFVQPEEAAEVYDLINSQKLTQECRDLTVIPAGDATPENTIDVEISYTTFFTKKSQEDVPVTERNTFRKHETVKYVMQLQSDSSWKVLTIG